MMKSVNLNYFPHMWDDSDLRRDNTQSTNLHSLIHGLPLNLFILICILGNFVSDCCLQISAEVIPDRGDNSTVLGMTTIVERNL